MKPTAGVFIALKGRQLTPHARPDVLRQFLRHYGVAAQAQAEGVDPIRVAAVQTGKALGNRRAAVVDPSRSRHDCPA